MSGIVLCDGSPSALKAVEFGGYPGMLLEKHEGTQLIVAHVWSKETNTVVRSASPNSRSPSSAGLPPTSMDGVRLAVSRATRDGFSGNDYPVYYVLHTVASTIQESKLLHTLNYKVETYVLPPITPKTDELDNNNVGGGAGKSGSLSARGISASSKASMAAKANSGRRGVEEPVREERIMAPEEIQKRRAEEIVAYGRQRAEHHHATALLLGPGNLLEGKTIVLGSVARAALRMLKTDFALYFIKEDGFTVRPTTAVMRCVVVVVVGNGGRAAAAEEKGILGPAPAELTQVTEEGKSAAAIDETEAVVDALAATAATVKGSFDAGAIHTASSSTPHPPLCSDGYWANRAAEEEAVAEGLLGADALAAGQAAVRYALSRRHANARLCVSVVLVADCTTTEEEVQRYEAAFESQLESAAAAARAPTATAVVAEEEEGDDDEGGASPPTEALEPAPVAVDAEVPHDTPPVPDAAASAGNNSISGSGNESATNPLPPQSLSPQPVEDLWPSVSVCRLKPTKHIAEPNVVNSTIQITKFLQQHKTEFVVLADNVPFVVQQAFLTTMKPHCVVVPHLRY